MEKRRERAAIAFSESRWSDSIAELDVVIEEKSEDIVVARCNRAACALKLGLWRSAVADCHAAIAVDSRCAVAFLRLGKALHGLGKPEQARAAWASGLRCFCDFETWTELKFLLTTRDSASAVAPVQALAPATANAKRQQQTADTDRLVAIGNVLVNANRFDEACAHFSELLQQRPALVGALLGRGTAHALRGRLGEAVADFTAALRADETCTDGWIRRGQALAASGRTREALADFNRAVEILGGADDGKAPGIADALQQRGSAHIKLANFRAGVSDMRRVVALDASRAQAWNHLGFGFLACGEAREAIPAYARATQLDPSLREAWANLGVAWKELGAVDRALAMFDRALEADPTFAHASHLKAVTLFGCGRHVEAEAEFGKAAGMAPPGEVDDLAMRGVARHGLGLFRLALSDYNLVVEKKPDHVAWYLKECALSLQRLLRRPLLSVCIDDELFPAFKEGWCKRNDPSTLVGYKPQPALDPSIPDLAPSLPPPSEQAEKLLSAAVHVGALLSYNCPGFLTNRRQQRAAGYSAISVAHWLRKSLGWPLPTAGRPRAQPPGWREVFEMATRWRQIAEPNDAVFWADKLSKEPEYGSHTSMVVGASKVIRYSAMAPRAFSIMRALAPRQLGLGATAKRAVELAPDAEALWEIVGRDFFVTTPCRSVRDPGLVFDGRG